MKYNKALDYMVVASQEFAKGNHQNAGRLFVAAQKHPSIKAALHILEANNKVAFKTSHPRLAASLTKRLKAESEDMDIVEDFDIEATDDGVEEILRTLDDEAEDLEEVEIEAEEDEDGGEEIEEIEEVDDSEIEAIVARMRAAKKGGRKVKASKARSATFAKVLRGMKG